MQSEVAVRLNVSCPSCGRRQTVGEQDFGRTILCTACQRPVVVPSVDEGDDAFQSGPSAAGRETIPHDGSSDAPRREPPRKGPNVLVILLIALGVLFVLCAGGIGVVAVAVPLTLSSLESSKRDIAKAQIKGVLVPAIERYKVDQEINPAGEAPSSLDDLLNSPAAGLKPAQLIDPWGHPYQYTPLSQHGTKEGYDIWSDGNGGLPIGNW
jgi:hypothetical protein